MDGSWLESRSWRRGFVAHESPRRGTRWLSLSRQWSPACVTWRTLMSLLWTTLFPTCMEDPDDDTWFTSLSKTVCIQMWCNFECKMNGWMVVLKWCLDRAWWSPQVKWESSALLLSFFTFFLLDLLPISSRLLSPPFRILSGCCDLKGKNSNNNRNVKPVWIVSLLTLSLHHDGWGSQFFMISLSNLEWKFLKLN